MAELRTLARPYAKAAFQHALNSGRLAEWSTQLSTMSALTAEAPVAALIDSHKLTASQLAEQFVGLLGDAAGEDISNFVVLLAEKKRLSLLPQVAELFAEFKAAHDNTVDVAIYTAFPLTDQSQTQLVGALARSLQREVKAEAIVDKDLLGGVLIKAGDVVIDGSLRGRLAKLSEAINL